MRMVLKGNGAVAHGVRLARAQVISAYPITPQTSIIEGLADMVSEGKLDAKFIKVESEHSALAGCISASSAGARVFTATSAQGLALMHELIHWAAGARLPIVLANVNRAMAPGWSIWTDQNDSLSQRDTGWMQVYCESSQEVVDSVIQAYKVSEKVLLPTMVILDAFFLSHTYEDVEVPEQSMVDGFLPPLDLPQKMDLERPAALGNLVFPDRYMEFRRKMDLAHDLALGVWEEVGREWGGLTGRSYGLVEEYRLEGAELVFVTAATAASTARVVIDAMREEGIPAGLLRLRVFRPFPAELLRGVLAGRKKVVVLDRNCSFGHHGIFHQEIKSALYGLPDAQRPPMYGFIAGLGGRDIRPDDIDGMLRGVWEGRITDPVSWWDVLEAKDPARAAVVMA
ncbi:MAG: pyruvate ferredoxin oxidoreductase [Acidobacteria bacterium]|nr:pyruvate ferredoxin oxidoreductase [Acidobacteriota bacterium]